MLGKVLLAKVRASSPPHGDNLAAELRLAHDRLHENQTRLLLTIGQFAAPLIFVPSYFLSTALFAALSIASVGFGARVFTRSRRRTHDVREFARRARLADARALRNSTPSTEGSAAYELERHGQASLRIEIPDGERTFTARITRERPRGFQSMDFTRIPTLFAPGSDVVIAFDPRGEMILGAVEHEPLPRATLQR